MEVEEEEEVATTKAEHLVLLMAPVLLQRKLIEPLGLLYEVHHSTIEAPEIMVK